MSHPKPLVLIVLDGWGYRAETKANAIALARKPTYDRLLREYPNTLIHTTVSYTHLDVYKRQIVLVAGHLADQRSLAVNDLIVRKRQHKVFLERVQHAEGELAVMILAVNGILLEVLERVVHPSHVPFHAEAQAAEIYLSLIHI